MSQRIDFGLDLVVVVLAAGTVAHHAALLVGLSRSLLTVTWLGLVVVGVAAVSRSSTHAPVLEVAPPDPSAVIKASVLAAGAATVLYMADGSTRRWWWLFWSLAAAALLAAIWSVLRERPIPFRPGRMAPAANGIAIVLVLAAAMGLAALVTARPDLDDVYVVNRSVYVEEHRGEVPTQDTLFSDRSLPGERAPLRSPAFEVLVGVVAAAAPVKAATVLYLWIAPLAAALSVLAIWRLVRTLSCPRPVVAVAGALLFLLLDGSTHGSFGNFGFARLWQGKVVLTSLLVPLLWTYAMRWCRDGSGRHLVLLGAANTAAVGLSSTGLFLGPLATLVAGVGPAVATRNVKRLLMAGAATAYPVAVALLNRLDDAGLQEASGPEATRILAPWSRWGVVFGRPAVAVCVVALALAWPVARDRASRAALAFAPLLVIVTLYGPRVLDPLRSLTPGAALILWRAIWALPVPVFVGMSLTVPWSVRRRSPTAATMATAVVLVAAALFAATTTPVMSTGNRATVGWPTWKTGGNTRVAERLVDEVPAGSLVAGPFDVDRVVPLVSSRVRAVDPRPGWYASGVDPHPRHFVQRALTTGISESESHEFGAAVDQLGVDGVALRLQLRDDPAGVVLLERGFVLRGKEGQYLILVKPA